MKRNISSALEWFDQQLISRDELLVHVGLDLADFGTRDDVAELPEWLKDDLRDWAQRFRKSKSWILVSNAGERDVSSEGRKLLELIEESGMLFHLPAKAD
jgi:hypothetical protein